MEVFSDQLNRKSSVGFRTKFWIARSFSPVLPLCVLPPLLLLPVTTCYGETGNAYLRRAKAPDRDLVIFICKIELLSSCYLWRSCQHFSELEFSIFQNLSYKSHLFVTFREL